MAIFILAFNIRKYRKARNVTIEQLADMLEAEYSQIGRIERGVSNPTVSMIFDIAAALNIQASQLLEPPQAEE